MRKPSSSSPRVCDLKLGVAHPPLSTAIARLFAELKRTGVALRPYFYLSNEYGCVVRTANVGLLWTDALPGRARPPETLARILRHETGHAFCYAHRLYRRADFRKLFAVKGHFFRTYPDGGWSPSPADERRLRAGEHINVRCLKHPDEDFAITFQTWLASSGVERLNPDEDWRRRWRHAPGVLRKLEFVEAMARHVGSIRVSGDRKNLDVPIQELTMTVEQWSRGVTSGPS